MTSTISRRTLAKGTLWSVPVIAAASAAPAMAASPCAVYKAGQPLPVSAFTATYIRITNDRQGNLDNRLLAVDFGFRISDEATSCGVTSGRITSVNAGQNSGARLSNGNNYTVTNGQPVPADGTAGTVNTSCYNNGIGGTQVCGTSGASAYNLADSKKTDGFSVTGLSIYRQVDVAGYGRTSIYLNASSFTGTSNSSRTGGDLSVSAARLF